MSNSKDKASEAKTALINSAFKLMISKGYTGTSIDEVCAAAGYTKGTFFYYFENKEAIGKGLLMRQKEMISGIKHAPFMQIEDPLARFIQYMDMISLLCQDPIIDSCIIGMFSEELADSSDDIRRLCAETFADWANFLQDMFEQIRMRYAPDTDVDSHGLAEYFIAIFEGSVILARAKGNVEPIAKSLSIFCNHICRLYGCELRQFKDGSI